MASSVAQVAASSTIAQTYAQRGCLHDLFAATMSRLGSTTASKRLAVVDPEASRQLTYEQFDRQSNALAQYLVDEMGAGRNRVVALFLEKSCEFALTYTAALKAGSAYMPIELAMPNQLIGDVLEETQPVAIVTERRLLDRIAPQFRHLTILLDSDETSLRTLDLASAAESPELKQFTSPPTTLDDLAYVVYSSGTTGKPKGIRCPHRGSVLSYLYRFEMQPFLDNERVACNIFFTWEMFRPLLAGVPLYIVPDRVISNPPLLCRFIGEHAITTILLTPSLLETVIETVKPAVLGSTLKSLRSIWLCGEVVSEALANRACSTLPDVRLMNLFSVSECHDVSIADLSDDYRRRQRHADGHSDSGAPVYGNQAVAPTGYLQPGVRLFILDSNRREVPRGVAGELWVAGATLALGYTRDELTARRFPPIPAHLRHRVSDLPESERERMYYCGDWGYIRADGQLQICGRCDSMVKIRGYSIELQAVEAVLQQSGLCQASAVVAHGAEGDDKRLVAYVLPSGKLSAGVDDDDSTSADDNTAGMRKLLRAHLKRTLPFYMCPSQYIFVESVPLSDRSGKLDRHKLPDPDRAWRNRLQTVDKGLPIDEHELLLSRIWERTLGCSADVDENFFDVGGHSLSAVRMLSMVEEECGVGVSIRELFEAPTISELAALLRTRKLEIGSGDASSSRIRLESRSSHVDLQHEVEAHDQTTLAADMQLRAFWRALRAPERWRRCSVLLTGATGFLGRHVLRELLVRSEAHVYCLVADRDAGLTAKDRLRQVLVRSAILSEDDDPPSRNSSPDSGTASSSSDEQRRAATIDHAFRTRVTALRGDVSLHQLGVGDASAYLLLSTDIDCIVHCAAYVNLSYPYVALSGANVLGTGNILQFATLNKVKALHYVSTDGVFPTNSNKEERLESDERPDWRLLTTGYSQTKWVAEQLVLRARERGLPTVVYRLGNLGADGETGEWNARDFNLLFLRSCCQLGAVPDDERFALELTPVEFVARTIVDAAVVAPVAMEALTTTTTGKFTTDPTEIYGKILHLVNPSRFGMTQLRETVRRTLGYASIESVSMTEWRRRLAQLADDIGRSTRRLDDDGASMGRYRHDANPAKLLQSLIADGDKAAKDLCAFSTPPFSIANLRTFYLEPSGIEYPPLDSALVASYVRHLRRRQLIGPLAVATSPTNPSLLCGRLALVTGASSGIGAAIVRRLARSGALVAAFARRADRLEQLADDSGGRACVLPIVGDVCQRSDLVDAVRRAEAHFGARLDILVNNAGVMYYSPLVKGAFEQWQRQLDVNCGGVLNALAAALPSMVDGERGHVVNITSDAGVRGFPGLAVYSGTKFFVEGLSQAMRHELKRHDIRVTCIQPGDVETELLQHNTDEEARKEFGGDDAAAVLRAEDVAAAVAFALEQPHGVGVNQILVEPTQAPI